MKNEDEIKEVSCPFCGSQIPNNVPKCRYCGEWVDKSKDPSISNKINNVFSKVSDEIKNIDTTDIQDKINEEIGKVSDEIDKVIYNDSNNEVNNVSPNAVKYCGNCGTKNNYNSKFCKNCGKKLSGLHDVNNSDNNLKKDENDKKILVGGIIVLIIVFTIVGVFVIMLASNFGQ